MKTTSFKILRMSGVKEMMGQARSTIYQQINDGLITHPVSLGGRNKGWPEVEIIAINAARIAGKSDDFIRALVKHLELARTNFASVAVIGQNVGARDAGA